MREENVLAAKLIPGPRERLGRLMSDFQIIAGPLALGTWNPASESSAAGPSGKRPRWWVPDKGQQP